MAFEVEDPQVVARRLIAVGSGLRIPVEDGVTLIRAAGLQQCGGVVILGGNEAGLSCGCELGESALRLALVEQQVAIDVCGFRKATVGGPAQVAEGRLRVLQSEPQCQVVTVHQIAAFAPGLAGKADLRRILAGSGLRAGGRTGEGGAIGRHTKREQQRESGQQVEQAEASRRPPDTPGSLIGILGTGNYHGDLIVGMVARSLHELQLRTDDDALM